MSALEKALEILTSIRYQTWPIEGMGVGLTAEAIDEVLRDGEAELKAQKRTDAKHNQERAFLNVLQDAAVRTWDVYLDYGPVDDGREVGKRFESALDLLMNAFVSTGARSQRKRRGRKGAE